MYRGFGGALTNQDRLILYSPLLCIAAMVIGIGWRKLNAKKEADPATAANGGKPPRLSQIVL
jgi:hypothetical protein